MHYQRWQHTGDPTRAREVGRRPKFQAGDRIGRLVIVTQESTTDQGIRYRCRCDCGNEIVVIGKSLGRRTNSCGCVRRENTVAQNQARRTHGHTAGGRATRTFMSWASMRDRCYLETAAAFPNYGGRGITVCDRWRESFENFLADMGERPAGMTLDRIDPNGHYEPGNCRWASAKVQARNRRKTDELTVLIRRYEGTLIAIRDGADNPSRLASEALQLAKEPTA